MNSWRDDLVRAVRYSKVKFESVEVVENEAHARALIAVLRAFAEDAAGWVFAEPCTPDRADHENARPADILILHPDLGCLFIEVKGWMVAEITSIEAGTITRSVAGREQSHNPWHQARNASAQLQNATRRVLQRRRLKRGLLFFDSVVAMPNISRAECLGKGYQQSIADRELLLRDDLQDTAALRERLKRFVKAKAKSRCPCTVEQINDVREALGSSTILQARDRRRPVERSTRLGTAIDLLESEEKRLSTEQMDLIEAEFDGRPQLVRGVAGSGKSIVLVRNFVNMLDRQLNSGQLRLDGAPSLAKRFAIVCFNRSLAPFLRRAFEDAFRERTFQSAPSCVDVLSLNRLQYQLSDRKGGPLTYQRYADADKAPDTAARFAKRYSEQLDQLALSDRPASEKILYDAIYVDEGQDLFEEEYLFLMRLLRVDPGTGQKNIVVFYDDAQNIYGRPRPTWSSLGIQVTGRRTYVMKTCYRNTRPVIDFAFNLLLGIGAETKIATKTFADIPYLKENDLVEELPDRWRVNFARRTEGTAPTVNLFATREEEKQWVAETVAGLLTKEEVRPDDILLLFCNPGEYRDLETRLKQACPSIQGFVKPFGHSSNPEKDQVIFKEGHLTLSTVEAAKGYDRPVVFVVGTDLFPGEITGRAQFYVAATRSKLTLYVTGLRETGSLADEAASVAALLKGPLPSPYLPSEPALATHEESLRGDEAARAEPPLTNLIVRLLRRGDKVEHASMGKGTVLSDGTPKVLLSQHLICQQVDVQFAGVKKHGLAAELAGLKLLPR